MENGRIKLEELTSGGKIVFPKDHNMQITLEELINKLSLIKDKSQIIEITEEARSFDGSVPPEFSILISVDSDCNITEINDIYPD